MATYTVTIRIDGKWLQQLPAEGFKLCFATCVESEGDQIFNVAAVAFQDLAPTMSVTWEEKYQIAASPSRFRDGAKFQVATNPVNIGPGQSYSVDSSWNGRADSDDGAPKDGILFKNDRIASSVLYKMVNGNPMPAYISPYQRVPGSETLFPKAKCKLWFSDQHDTSSMVAAIWGYKSIEIDLTGRTSAEVSYTGDGRWSQ